MTLTPTVVREYDNNTPEETDTATFGLGCFWGPDARFGALDGVVRTRVGYAGGMKDNPSYEHIGDHTEVVQVDYDPEQLSFTELVEHAFQQHNPHQQPPKRQYHHLIFTATAEQEATLETYLETNDYDTDTLATRIEPLERFYIAENYHQKFNLRGKRWITESFDMAGYDEQDIRESPAAAKLNGHVAGHEVNAPALLHQRRP